MSLYAKIKCGNCKKSFEVYHQTIELSPKPMHCPHCLQEMSEKQWSSLINCFYTVDDFNHQAQKANREHGASLFTIELRYKHSSKS